MAFKYDTVVVTAESGKEEVKETMVDFRDVTRFVHGITLPAVADVNLVVYKESVKEVLIPSDQPPLVYEFLPLEIELRAGQVLRVGIANGATTTQTPDITVKFELR